ncbi:MAG: zinc-dependent peptidase [Chitinophagaceae bacterium]
MEVVIFCLLVFLAVLISELISKLHSRYKMSLYRKLFLKERACYETLISRNLRYFHCLDTAQQDRLLFRTFLFHQSKKFHYVGITARPEMPVLISAVAAQLTLGLETFSLDFFKNIYVLEHDYHYGYYSLPFMGHVDQSGIYLSWDNFVKGIASTPDCSNVGLHEMAHALTYVNFITKTEEDKHFSKEFKNFSRVARPIFQEMQKGLKTLLGDYAATNYHEFWAVSVEMFFENPYGVRHQMPELYRAMCNLLNQDPIEQVRYKRTIIYNIARTA